MEKDYTLKTLMKLIYLIDSKDNYTKMHSQNVTKYALLLGKELNLDEDKLKIIEIGAMLHDVGKIGVWDFVLMKPSSLTSSEYEMMKRHVTIGEALLPIEGYEEIKKMIRSHHERLDGRGYPDGLKGCSIPYFARLLSVVDSFDAMTTKRSYNKVKTLDEAIKELYKASRKQFDKDNNIIQQLDPYLVISFIKEIKKDVNLMEHFKKQDEEIVNSIKSNKTIE